MSTATKTTAASLPVSAIVVGTRLRRFRRALVKQRDFITAWCSEDPEEVHSHCRKLAPAVLLVEESFLSSLNSPEFWELADFGRRIRVLVWLHEAAHTDLEALLRLGCVGGIPRSATPKRIVRAIRAVAAGELWASRLALSELVRALLAIETPANPRHLTRRELDVLDLISRGLKNQEIAQHLSISRETVRWHLRSLYNKIGAADRLHLAIAGGEYLARNGRMKSVPSRIAPRGTRAVSGSGSVAV